MDEKKMVYIIIGLLGLGCAGVLFMVVPWILGRGMSNWKEIFLNDALLIGFALVFGYGVYMGVRTQNKK